MGLPWYRVAHSVIKRPGRSLAVQPHATPLWSAAWAGFLALLRARRIFEPSDQVSQPDVAPGPVVHALHARLGVMEAGAAGVSPVKTGVDPVLEFRRRRCSHIVLRGLLFLAHLGTDLLGILEIWQDPAHW